MIPALSLLAGVLLGLATAVDIHAAWPGCALGTASVAFVTIARRLALVRALILLIGGVAMATLAVGRWQELQWPPEEADTRLLLEGRVRGVPARDGAEVRFDAEVRIVGGRAAADERPRLARLRWRDAPVLPRAGERWQWLVRVSAATGTRNFAGLDVARHHLRDRIHLSGEVLTASLTSRLELAPASVHTWRARVALRIAEHVADPEAAALITALAVGITSGMSTDQWRVFNATGTTHLVAISGMHVTLFAAVMFFVARRAWRGLRFTHITREPFALTLGLLAAGAYSMLAGFSVPTQRTLLMLTIFALARASARQVGGGHTWSLAMIGVLLFDVFAPLDAGFWLSFIAVGVILMFATTPLRPDNASRQWLQLQWAITLALAPLTFLVFGGVSVAGLAVNLVAIPVISFVLVPLVLAGAVFALSWPAGCQPFFALADALHEWLWPALVWAADLDFAVWRREPTAAWLLLSLPAGLLLLLRWPPMLRASAAAMVLPLTLALPKSPPTGEARVLVLDAGRGSSALVTTRNFVLLFDTGDTWNTHGTRAARVVIPAMDASGLARIDRLLVPRLDADRAQGVALLAHEREVAQIVVGGHWQGTNLPVRACRDETFARDGVTFDMVAVGRRDCVLRVSVGPHSLFLAGDLDADGEGELLDRFPNFASDVVLMSRGAGTQGSSPRWIEGSHARLAVAAGGAAGTASRERILDRWREAGVPVLDVQREGDLEIGLAQQGFAVLRTARSARYPFAWRRVE